MDIKNDAQLKQACLFIIDQVINDVIIKLHAELIKNINEIVYSPYNDDRKMYAYGRGIPTYQFRESWNANIIHGSNEVIGIIEQDPTQMDFDPENYIHGSWLGDVRNILAQILNEGTSTSIFGSGWWERPRPFWDTTKQLLENGTVDKWIKQSFKSHGVKIQEM